MPSGAVFISLAKATKIAENEKIVAGMAGIRLLGRGESNKND
jgi:hypothetical protein